MKRDILKIDEELCNGCGLCVPNCLEGALQVIDGKIRLTSELMCDGLGACIGHCPEGAISIETREAEPYNETLAAAGLHAAHQQTINLHHEGGCPGSRAVVLEREDYGNRSVSADQPSELRQWPVQMHLINPGAKYFQGSDLLLAADCTAYSMGAFHTSHLRGKTLAIACPKLDQGIDSYVNKITALVEVARVKSITVMMMEVPCCGGLLQMVMTALAGSSGKVPVRKMIVGINGDIQQDDWLKLHDI